MGNTTLTQVDAQDLADLDNLDKLQVLLATLELLCTHLDTNLQIRKTVYDQVQHTRLLKYRRDKRRKEPRREPRKTFTQITSNLSNSNFMRMF